METELKTPREKFHAIAETLWVNTLEPSQISSVSMEIHPQYLVLDLMKIFMASKIPVILWGPVGAGKTQVLESLAALKDVEGVPFNVITITPSTEDPTVLHGIYYIADEKGEDGSEETLMKRSIPDVAKQISDYWKNERGLTIIFADEMTTCMASQQHALLGLLTGGNYGDVNIEPYSAIVMAANPQGTVDDVNDLGVQVMNRAAHMPWYGDVDRYLELMKGGWEGNTKITKLSGNSVQVTAEVLSEYREEAFRKEGSWDIEDLVPSERLEHTPRSVTYLSEAITTIEKFVKAEPSSFRETMVHHAATALLGETWGKRYWQSYKDVVNRSISWEEISESLDTEAIYSMESSQEVLDSTLLARLKTLSSIEAYKNFSSEVKSSLDEEGLENAKKAMIAIAIFAENDPSNVSLFGDVVRQVAVKVQEAITETEDDSLKQIFNPPWSSETYKEYVKSVLGA